jgi:Protein of unknown function (DUF3455)
MRKITLTLTTLATVTITAVASNFLIAAGHKTDPGAAIPIDSTRLASETAPDIFHAEGAQIYECKSGPDGRLMWQVREPIATLLLDGRTVGRHFAGPTWEHNDGSTVRAKVVGTIAGSTGNDIPWIKLAVTLHLGSGTLSDVTTIQRINTKGGLAQGPCDSAGGFLSVPYHADYVFLRSAG